MNAKAQVHLEAIIAMAFLAGFCAIAMASIESTRAQAYASLEFFKAESNAQECALIANALFSNTESTLKKTSANCFSGNEFEIKSSFEEKEKNAFSIARNIKTIRTGKETVLEVKTSAHYK